MNIADEGVTSFGVSRESLRILSEDFTDGGQRFESIHSDVDHNGSGLDVLVIYKGGSSHGRNQNIRFARDAGQILGLGVAHGDGRVFMKEHQREGLSHDIAAADHHRSLAAEKNLATLEYFHDS